MNFPHLHLVLTHFPIAGIFLGILFFILYKLFKNSEFLKSSLIIFIFSAITCIPLYLSGEEAEEVVEHMPGISEEYIEHHEENALITLILVETLGLLSVVLLVLDLKNKKIPFLSPNLVLVVALISAYSIASTANMGGEIMHKEIREDFKPSKRH